MILNYPGFLERKIARWTCSACKSEMMSRIERGKGTHNGQLVIQSKALQPSHVLAEIVKEEQAWNALTPEEQDAAVEARHDTAEAEPEVPTVPPADPRTPST